MILIRNSSQSAARTVVKVVKYLVISSGVVARRYFRCETGQSWTRATRRDKVRRDLNAQLPCLRPRTNLTRLSSGRISWYLLSAGNLNDGSPRRWATTKGGGEGRRRRRGAKVRGAIDARAISYHGTKSGSSSATRGWSNTGVTLAFISPYRTCDQVHTPA